MKDNTAAVHAQVPVEVAAFLLNEKRPEIAKIELKQRISVLLVPNRSLETPHYKIERLKHDDPRLDRIEASYKMAEEIEDPTTVTRRSQEPTNKQSPVIKGVLPDAPAPIAPLKPEPAAAVAAAPAAAPAPAAATGGFFGWLKRLFGGESAAPTETKPEKKEEKSREGRGERGRRGGRRGERGGERSEGQGEGRESRGRRGEGRSAEGERAERPARGERSERSRGERRPDNRGDAAASGATGGADAAVAETDVRSERAPRGERGERGEGSRRERGEGRRERGERRERNAEAPANASDAPVLGTELQAGDNSASAPGQEGQGERRERRSRDRYGRDRRDGREGRESREGHAPRSDEAGLMAAESTAPELATANPAEAPADSEAAPRTRSYFDRANTQPQPQPAPAAAETVPAAAPVAAAVAADAVSQAPAPVAAPAAPASTGLPRVQPYELPLSQLQAIASGSGLEWVNSDADKVAAVQAVIAAEPRPVHVPRERPPAVVIDEGPLVLVETRRDLAEMKLPF